MSFSFKNLHQKESKFTKFKKSILNFYHFFNFKKLKKEKYPRKLNIIIGGSLAVIGIFVVYQVFTFSYAFIKDFEIKDVLFSFGEELKTDENGYTNILLLGKGGGEHDGPELTDTIIVASYDTKTNSVSMLSIPRDFYVRTEYYGSSRINEVVRNVKNRLIYRNKYEPEEARMEGIKIMENKIEELVELDLHYYATIDFNGFKAIVDALDGIDVVVENDIKDTTYPADTGWGYQTFEITEGPQHLDGDTALKYARSRHTTSDFDRAKRQQSVIQAIKEKALEVKTLTSPTKIKKLFNSISDNFQTDLSIGEIITLAKVASKIDKNNMISKVLTDDPNQEGGFLATPPRDQYGGAFVLIPYSGDLEEIHTFTRLIFKSREIYLEKANIEIQNGTYYGGIAGKAATQLERYGFFISDITNTENDEKFENSKIILKNRFEKPVTSLLLPIILDAEEIDQTPTQSGSVLAEREIINETEANENLEETKSEADIILILGTDYEEVTRKL